MTSSTSAGGGPDVLEEDVVAVGVLAERVVEQVDVHRAGQRVGHDQRRRREVVHLHVGVDPALEVAVARQHRDDREVVVVDGLAHLGDERAGVADAGGAAVADEVEAELVEVRRQAGLLVVVGDDLRAGRQRGLDPRLALQALLDGLLGQQRRADHHRRVGGVGARRDRRDRDRAVVELELRAVGELDVDRVARPAAAGRGRGEVPVGAAVAVAVVGRRRREAGKDSADGLVVPVLVAASPVDVVGERGAEALLGVGQRRPGPAGASGRPATGRRWRGRARASRSSAARRRGRARGPAPWRRPRPARAAPRGRPVSLRYSMVSLVDREDRDGGAELRAHVADRRAVGQRQRRDARAVELDELADHAVLAQHLGDREHQVGGGRRPRAGRR